MAVFLVPVDLPDGVQVKRVIGYSKETDTLYDLQVCGPARPVDWKPANPVAPGIDRKVVP